VSPNSGIRQQGWHHPTVVMGNPGLLQELPDIPSLLSERGGDGEQACPADGSVGRLDTMTDLALDDGRTQGSLGSVVGGLDSLNVQEGPQRISHLQGIRSRGAKNSAA
jgi:hypothetical protein